MKGLLWSVLQFMRRFKKAFYRLFGSFCNVSTLEMRNMTRVQLCETVEEEVCVAKSLRTLSRIVCKWKNVAQLKGTARANKLNLVFKPK